MRVEAVGDHLLVAIGVAPLIDDGAYRFEVTLGSQPPIAIELPFVVAGPQAMADGLIDGYALTPRGVSHVGLS
jgi:hypothetical protein